MLRDSPFGNRTCGVIMTALISHPASALTGDIPVPGDKSISHRALMLAALAVGESRISGLLEGEDVLRTRDALRALGVTIGQVPNGDWAVHGVGIGGFHEPSSPLDMGNSGTSARLMMGLLATTPLTAVFHGDCSLSARPMGRVIEPLSQFGAVFQSRQGTRLPIALTGAEAPLPVTCRTRVPSAQVKSAILLAGLNAPGRTTVEEETATRDHTERMLDLFGAEIETDQENGILRITLTGQPELSPASISVPGDPSSAAFPIVAALLTQGSDITVRNVCINPLRIGLFQVLRKMGADIIFENERLQSGEPVADISVRTGSLSAIEPDPAIAACMIDEFPILFVAAACAKGRSVFHGLKELRVKESDRLHVMAEGLKANGVAVEEFEDGIAIEGCSGPPPGGGKVQTHLDHRIAMSFLMLGLAAENPIVIDNERHIATSFPGFAGLMNGLGAKIGPGDSA